MCAADCCSPASARFGPAGHPVPGQGTLAAQVADAVASAACPTFLIGQFVSRALLLRSEPVVPHDSGWRQFPTTVAAAMDQYLASAGGHAEQDRVEDLLRPLAYARGNGLPLEDAGLWARLATALARPGRSHTTGDVATLLDTPADYLVETVITGQAAYYRLYHKALSDRLRERYQQHPHPLSVTQTAQIYRHAYPQLRLAPPRRASGPATCNSPPGAKGARLADQLGQLPLTSPTVTAALCAQRRPGSETADWWSSRAARTG